VTTFPISIYVPEQKLNFWVNLGRSKQLSYQNGQMILRKKTQVDLNVQIRKKPQADYMQVKLDGFTHATHLSFDARLQQNCKIILPEGTKVIIKGIHTTLPVKQEAELVPMPSNQYNGSIKEETKIVSNPTKDVTINEKNRDLFNYDIIAQDTNSIDVWAANTGRVMRTVHEKKFHIKYVLHI